VTALNPVPQNGEVEVHDILQRASIWYEFGPQTDSNKVPTIRVGVGSERYLSFLSRSLK
jgi:hypothetical protein